MRANDFRPILWSVVLLCAVFLTRQTSYASPPHQRSGGTGEPCTVRTDYNFLPGGMMGWDRTTGQMRYSNQEIRLTVPKDCSQPLRFSLDILADLSRSRGWKSTSTIWIEPLGPSVFGVYLWTERIPTNARAVFGESAPAPMLNGELKFVSGPDGGTGTPLLTDGMTVWGATQGPLNINGKARCNIRAAQIVNSDLAPAFLCESAPSQP